MSDTLSVLKDNYNVSHETLSELLSFHDLLFKWQKRLNLISPKTINEIWDRHILDSAQLCSFLPKNPCCILDIGSGAGLPGIVLSILTNHKIHLVESDQKKCAFLRTAISRINLNASVYETRLEDMPTLKADIITARAFAPLPRLLALTQKQHHPKLRFLLLKGRDVSSELINIDSWQKIRVVNQHTSITSEDGCILELQCNDAL
jgi:16S rRNA (guanine527-N7)-methyltransferase